MKEIHFYESEYESCLNYNKPVWEQETFYYGYMNTEKAIDDNMSPIHTLQIGLLSTSLFKQGYRIFVHDMNHNMYEIKLGSDNERTNREIKMEHNLFKLWMNNEFLLKSKN